MKIALIGAAGNAGSRILAELSRRGHAVTAIARNPARIPELKGVTPLQADANDVAGLAAALPDCTEVYLPELNHFIPMQAPELVANYIRAA